MHPFGCEAETSLQDLFEYFKRCLQHGEWELASACVPQLVNSTGDLSKNLQEIIKAIIFRPYNLKWESVGSPHKLAWFWLQVLEKWTAEQVPPNTRRELEFLLLLEELGSEGISETTLKEIQQAFLGTQSVQMAPNVSRSTATAAVESSLRILLEKKKPRLAQTLAHFLQDQSCVEDQILQHAFIQHLLKKLEKPERCPEWVEEMYSVLAVMPWKSHRSGGQLEALCEALWGVRGGPLKEERILSSLLRPQCDTLVSVYCSTALRLQRDNLLRSSPHTQVELPEAEKLALALCCHKDRPSIWKTIYFECLNSGKHFLEQVLVTALDLIKHEEFSQLKDLLQLEFQPLCRLLLLLGWTQCRSLSSAQMLLSILHNDQAAANDSVLQVFANLLSSQLGILEWCKTNNPGISMEALLAQLQTLDSHSALYILHSLTPLPQFEERRILDLLQQLQHSTESDGTEAVGTLIPVVQRNIVLFQGFCAMKYAIYALCVNAHTCSNCTKFDSVQQHQTLEAEMDQSKTSASSEGCHLLFQHYLSECQLYLEVVPAMFRLELLENIFSLLFLSTADFALQVQKDSCQKTDNHTQSECFTKTRGRKGEKTETTVIMNDNADRRREKQKLCLTSVSENHGYLDLGHFIQGCRGFLVDVTAMEGFLKLLKEGLEGMSVVGQQEGQEAGRALHGEAEAAACLGCSVTEETFGSRLQRLTKRTAEAQWRLQIITSNQNSGNGLESPVQMPSVSCAVTTVGHSTSSSLRRRRRPGRHSIERRISIEKHNGEVSTSASDGGGGPTASCAELEFCPCGGPHSWLVPSMLSSPESLLMSCIRRGNFMEAHQVSVVFDLEASACCGELAFMERYKEVLVELGEVEQKMESQSMSSSSSSSEGLGSAAVSGTGRSRLGSSGRSTLQAIGSAAAAGVAFYSISDIADRLLSTPAHPLPSLEEGYWLDFLSPDASGLLHTLLKELSPAAMAAFDLACCHCQLWKTSRQLLDAAERRLNHSLETRGVRADLKAPHTEGICGFPMVLQQINKILNHPSANKGSVKSEAVGEDQVFASPFGCSIQEVLLCCHPTLSEDLISAQLGLVQRLENILHNLNSAIDGAEGTVGSALLALLVEQASLKQSELNAHPVRSSMKRLLRSLDTLCPFEPDVELARPDYVRSFFDYINILAAVLIRSLSSEDQTSEVRLGNPLLVLLQAPLELLSHLLFDRQVSPDRVLSLLQQEGLRLSIQQVIVQRCCESLTMWISSPGDGVVADQAKEDVGAFGVATLSVLLQQYAQDHRTILGLNERQSDVSSESEASVEDHSSTSTKVSTSSSQSPSSSSSSSSISFLLTPSTLSFLKSRSPLLAALACLSASKRENVKTQSSGWSGYFRSGRKEIVLDGDQISREADGLLREFPILQAYLYTLAEPVLGTPLSEAEESSATLGTVVCGKPLVSLLLSGPQEEAAQAVAAEAFRKALDSRDMGRALILLELYGQGGSQEGVLRDRLLACAALEDGDEGVRHLFRVQDPNLRAHVALQDLERWPLSSCLELLEFCLNDPSTEESLKIALEAKKKELDVYHRMLNLQCRLPWATWQELKNESKTNSESMLSMVLEAKEFDLCVQWVELHPVSDQLRMQLQTEHLLYLLEKGQMDEAFQLLEGLSDFAVGLEVCEHALDRRPGLAACHFLADYLTLHFQRQVSPARQQHIHALHLGSKVLLTLPQAAREHYFHLLSNPLLMLEQLLMNLKVEWVDVAVQTLRSLLVDQKAGFTVDDIDKLLADYASKALDFSCAPKERSRSDSVISLHEGLMQCPAQDSSLSSSRIESPAPSATSTPTHTPSSNSTDREKDRVSSGKKRGSPAKFQPPEQPPARKDWVPDAQQRVCMVCQRERFTMFNRRHHCRRCGRLVCQSCSERKMPVEGCPGEEVRICDQCYSYFHPDSDDEMEDVQDPGSPIATDVLDGMLHLPEVDHRQFQLSTNEAQNQLLRSEFYYEQAPSAHLCISILTLHSDQTACGHQLISHCRSLSCRLTNPEVDACLLTNIMRQLLFSAKLMFVKVGRSQDLAQCDSYISKVDVLKILVTANYKYVPSLDDILETSAIARLRNQLLESEYYQLAVEVSTKSGLDPGGVWQAWAMASLKAGNFLGAREKFARCLKAPVDRSQLNLGPLLLQEVVQHLETSGWPSLATQSFGEDIFASLVELEEALSEVGSVERPERLTHGSSLYQECLYYLSTYGTHLALISFYMRHDRATEALTYLLDKKDCPDDVFLEGVLQPCLEHGRLGMIQGILEKLDPSLETCSRYLIASCQFLQRRGYFHSLYQLQKFMTDHVRAAMTCIRFFTHGATSYLELGERQRWLARAKEHLRTYLQEQQNRGAGRRKSSTNSFRKMMSSSDVSRHMNTIELQLEVTRFLHRCENVSPSKVPQTSPPPSKSSQSTSPPTLFGGSPVKVEVACKVMLGGKNIEEGFGIAYRVIQDFQLEAQAVYMRAGQKLIRQRQYGAVRQLLKCVGESGTATKNDCDALVLSCVSIADKGPSDAKEVESLILEIKVTESKIKAYLLCGKLRPGYLLAVKLEKSRAGPLVQEVLQAAEEAQDSVMQNICQQWLAEHSSSSQQRQSRPSAR